MIVQEKKNPEKKTLSKTEPALHRNLSETWVCS